MIVQQRIPTDTTDWISAESQKMKKSSEPDDLIDAHLSGIKKGLSKNEKLMQEAFDSHLKKALDITVDYFDEIKKDLNPKDMFLKAHNITSFEALILVDKSKYLNKNLRSKAYDKLRILSDKFKSDTFRLSFSFKPVSDSTDEEIISSNGFFFKYAPKSR